jgi:DNA replication protein DnaC
VQARFRVAAHLQELDYHASQHLKRDQIAQLATGEWIAKGQNLLLTGPCGSGKTYLVRAGEAACMRDYSVRY